MRTKYKKNFFGFTLVELIIVITILTILATIGFISYSGYNKSSRDSKRITEIKSINDSMIIYKEKTSSFPTGENMLDIFSYGKQGYVGDSMKKVLNISGDLLDPLDNQKYTYIIDSTGKKVQIGTYLENQKLLSYLFYKTFADGEDLTNRYFYVVGDNIGILTTSNTNQVLQSVLTGSVVLSSYTGGLNAYYNNATEISGTGGSLISQINTISASQINTGSGACTLGINFILGGCKL